MAFALKVILSFIVGGGFVSLVIWLSERLGSRIGSAIAGVPSTISISLIFICFTEGSKTTRSASTIVPVIILASLLYAAVFVYTTRAVKKTSAKYLVATLAATIGWLVTAAIIRSLFDKANILITIPTAIVGILIAHFLFKSFRSAAPKNIKPPMSVYAIRFVIAGAVVAVAVITAKLLGPLWGGTVSTFPATVASSLYFLNKSQGCAFTEGFVKRFPLSFLSAVLFIILLHSTLTHLAAVWSFVIGLGSSLIYTYFLLTITSPAAKYDLAKVVNQRRPS